jgi:hypothetical protein
MILLPVVLEQPVDQNHQGMANELLWMQYEKTYRFDIIDHSYIYDTRSTS